MATKEAFTRFFHESDTDKDGYLSYEELVAKLRGKGLPEHKLQVAFRQSNTSGNNLLSLNEFLYAMGFEPEEERREIMMRRLFREFDRNGDGKITKDEIKQVFSEVRRYLSDKELQGMIAIVDADKSGTIDYEEFLLHFFGKTPAK